jgi:hypothetical protein
LPLPGIRVISPGSSVRQKSANTSLALTPSVLDAQDHHLQAELIRQWSARKPSTLDPASALRGYIKATEKALPGVLIVCRVCKRPELSMEKTVTELDTLLGTNITFPNLSISIPNGICPAGKDEPLIGVRDPVVVSITNAEMLFEVPVFPT